MRPVCRNRTAAAISASSSPKAFMRAIEAASLSPTTSSQKNFPRAIAPWTSPASTPGRTPSSSTMIAVIAPLRSPRGKVAEGGGGGQRGTRADP